MEFSETQSEFPLRLRRFIIHHLDPEDKLEMNNWRCLVEYLHLPFSEEHWLEDQKNFGRSPTDLLLSRWIMAGKSLQEFNNLMKEIRRPDIVDEIRKYLKNEQQQSNFFREMRKTFHRHDKRPKTLDY
mgnify:CR=1 FL=1